MNIDYFFFNYLNKILNYYNLLYLIIKDKKMIIIIKDCNHYLSIYHMVIIYHKV